MFHVKWACQGAHDFLLSRKNVKCEPGVIQVWCVPRKRARMLVSVLSVASRSVSLWKPGFYLPSLWSNITQALGVPFQLLSSCWLASGRDLAMAERMYLCHGVFQQLDCVTQGALCLYLPSQILFPHFTLSCASRGWPVWAASMSCSALSF